MKYLFVNKTRYKALSKAFCNNKEFMVCLDVKVPEGQIIQVEEKENEKKEIEMICTNLQ